MTAPTVVDSAVLALVLGITERRVRHLVKLEVLVPLPDRARVRRTGRPRLMFDLDEAENRVRNWRVA
jgi:predicted ArsR family transcriptional regulator